MNPPQIQTWQPPNHSLTQRLLIALHRAMAVSVVLSAFFVAALSVMRNFQFDASFIARIGVFSFAVFAPLFAVFLIATSRSWSDRAFTVSGFLATFFGLAILAIFFVQLAAEIGEYFHYTPQLVEMRNAALRNELAELEDDHKKKLEILRRDLAELEEARAEALKDAAKEDIAKISSDYDESVAILQSDLAKGAPERKLIAERSLRESSSPFAIFGYFLSSSPSDRAENAGIAPALFGSIWLAVITIFLSVPVGVGAALYLEEYRQEGWLARIIQININNLAGVPSVVFGILGGFVFVYIFKQLHLQDLDPSSDPRNLLGGGLTLGLLTLPMVIVSSQEAIRAVPISLRQGAYALGATKWQVMWTIVLPMARPGILTGTILSLSRAIGEAAPLVLFGGQVFVDQNPTLFSRFTALPLQIFNWCGRFPVIVDGPDGPSSVDLWKYNAAVASGVLLVILLSMNAIAIVVRNRAQKKMRY